MPGFDTHAAQGSSQGRLAARLTELSQALASFRADLGDRFQNVTVLVCTEFGRTAAENGARGTDHGHGSVMFLMGGRVAGGRVVTRWPGLAKDRLFQGRDLAVTTDYRDVFWEVAEEALGLTSSTALFPGHRRRALGLFRPAAVSAQGGSLPGRGP